MTDSSVDTEDHATGSEPDSEPVSAGAVAATLGSSDSARGRLDRVLTLEGDILDRVFAILLFLFFGVLLATTPQYSPDSRLFPIVIGVPTIILLSVLILAQFSERFGALVGRYASSDLFGLDDRFAGDLADANGEGEPLDARRKRLVILALWMCLLFALVVVIGFIPATVVFLLAFYRVFADVGWPRTIGYTVVFTAIVVFVFDFVMGTRLYEGLLGIRLPF